MTFIQFDIIDFYSPISEDLLINSLNSAKNYVDITEGEQEINTASRRSILIYNDSTWVKRCNENCNVPMGHSTLPK